MMDVTAEIKPGLLIQAQDKYNLKLSDHYFIGDDQRDIEAGESSFTKPLNYQTMRLILINY